jgi:hypothetical protein
MGLFCCRLNHMLAAQGLWDSLGFFEDEQSDDDGILCIKGDHDIQRHGKFRCLKTVMMSIHSFFKRTVLYLNLAKATKTDAARAVEPA